MFNKECTVAEGGGVTICKNMISQYMGEGGGFTRCKRCDQSKSGGWGGGVSFDAEHFYCKL